MSEHPLPDALKEEANAAPPVNFPALPAGPAVFYDDERHEAWIGIPFQKVDNPLFVLTSIDGAKTAVLANLMKHQQVMIAQQKLTSGIGGKVKKTLTDIFDKANSLIH